eukprot:TRINITY_DN0_c203_g1_i3.p1 TRINITY_DN0_c203_g1~~TRINITY_DN0_c203_g1_i3.p1  ORF type:complete len:139 (+),score=49.52 TRINITY_DN0_c203_g1_i3:53-469(+)
MEAGIGATDACVSEFNKIKMSKSSRYIIYHIVDKRQVEIESIGERTASYEDFLKALPRTSPRYVVYDFNYTTNEVPPREVEKLLFVYWCPDEAEVKEKMVYATTKESFKKKLVGLAKDIQAKDIGDLDHKSLIDALRG